MVKRFEIGKNSASGLILWPLDRPKSNGTTDGRERIPGRASGENSRKCEKKSDGKEKGILIRKDKKKDKLDQ
jgi:hypothetical protein